jgi:glycosyltransferase involved in cell wall biosynthesis
MKIAINTLPITHGKTGIGYYAQDLFKATSHCQSANFLYITSNKGIPDNLKEGKLDNIEELKVDMPSPLWEQLHMQDELRFRNVDIYHSPLFTCPIVKEIPSIITIHDVIPESNPEFCTQQFLDFYSQHVSPSIRASEKIITTSEFSKKEIIKYFKVPEQKISVIYQAISQQFLPGQKPDFNKLKKELNLPEKYILYVGILDPRKNIERLISAFSIIAEKQKDLHLVIVGRTDDPSFDINALIKASGCLEKIHLLGYLSDEKLTALYSSAHLFAFPSFLEGFGRPVIEAMASGVPVICSNTSSLPEIACDSAEYFDPHNIDEIADAINKITQDNALRKKMIKSGIKRSKDFTHKEFSRQLDACYRELGELI